MEIVESVIAAVKQVGIDLGNALLCTCNVYLNGVFVIDAAQHIKEHTPVGVILVHSYFLTDDALLLADGLLGEIGLLDKIQQYFQGGDKVLGAGEKIAGPVE